MHGLLLMYKRVQIDLLWCEVKREVLTSSIKQKEKKCTYTDETNA